MTAHTAFASPSVVMVDAKKQHRRLVMMISALIVAVILALIVYGADYYSLSQADRPSSAKHHLLKPGGAVGINLGILGVLMLCGIFLYPLRKRWSWLQKQGDSKHWLDHHVVLGVAAPICIAFHSSFKFRGLAGIAFWVMVAVSLSGLIGRYLYAQIPRQVETDEVSLRIFREVLDRQEVLPQAELRQSFQLPASNQVSRRSAFAALAYMVRSDLARPFRVARLRIKVMGAGASIRCVIGLRPRNAHLEGVISLARKQALLSRRIAFLSHAQRVFRLWHVVHRPFSYAFAVLALAHIVVAMLLGFF
ncbi:MAG TPA: hypothetical protein VEU94_03330 [Terriglobales bacterium]|nr:hypothetical protein [Terriglobales bacterium]